MSLNGTLKPKIHGGRRKNPTQMSQFMASVRKQTGIQVSKQKQILFGSSNKKLADEDKDRISTDRAREILRAKYSEFNI